VKAVRIALFLLFGAVAPVFAQGGAQPLIEKANDLFQRQKFKEAAEVYAKVLKDYPTNLSRDLVHLELGRAYIYDAQYANAVTALTPLLEDGRNKEAALQATFFIPLAQFLQGKQPDVPTDKKKELFTQAVEGFNKYLEGTGEQKQEAQFYRGLSYLDLKDWAKAQADFQKLVNTYRGSDSHPTYVYYLGRSYWGEALEKLNVDDPEKAKLAAPTVEKAITVWKDLTPQTSEIFSNQAQFDKSVLLFVQANQTEDTSKLPMVLSEYRKVRSRDEMVPILEKAISDLQKAYGQAAVANNRRAMMEIQERLALLNSQLSGLKEGVDPAIQAYLQMGVSFMQMGQIDEARMLLRRIQPIVEDKIQKQVTIEIIKSLAMQGAAKQADEGLDKFLKDHPGDEMAESVSMLIGNALLEQGKYQEAIQQFDRSMKDFPEGRAFVAATVGKSTALVKSGNPTAATSVLEELSKSKAGTAIGAQADYSIGEANFDLGQYDKAVEAFRRVLDNPKGTGYREGVYFKIGETQMAAGKFEDAVATYREYLKEFPTAAAAPNAYFLIASAQYQNKQPAEAAKTIDELVKAFPKSDLAPRGLLFLGESVYGTGNAAEMIKAYERLFKEYPDTPFVIRARYLLAHYYNTIRDYEKAREQYNALIAMNNPEYSSFALSALGKMLTKAANGMGRYQVFTAAQKTEFEGYLDEAEAAFQKVGTTYPQTKYLSDSISGLYDIAELRKDAGLYTDADAQRFFDEKAALMSDPNARSQIELAKAAWPYDEKGDMVASYALYDAAIKANPSVLNAMGREDARRYGALLILNNRTDDAIALFENLKMRYPKDARAQWEVDYGLGSAYLAKKDYARAEGYLKKFEDNSHARYAQKDLALIGYATVLAQTGKPSDAISILGKVARSRSNSGAVKAQALVSMARILEATGKAVPPASDQKALNAAHCYSRAERLVGLSDKPLGKWLLEQEEALYTKAGMTKEAAEVAARIAKKYAGVTAAAPPY